MAEAPRDGFFEARVAIDMSMDGKDASAEVRKYTDSMSSVMVGMEKSAKKMDKVVNMLSDTMERVSRLLDAGFQFTATSSPTGANKSVQPAGMTQVRMQYEETAAKTAAVEAENAALRNKREKDAAARSNPLDGFTERLWSQDANGRSAEESIAKTVAALTGASDKRREDELKVFLEQKLIQTQLDPNTGKRALMWGRDSGNSGAVDLSDAQSIARAATQRELAAQARENNKNSSLDEFTSRIWGRDSEGSQRESNIAKTVATLMGGDGKSIAEELEKLVDKKMIASKIDPSTGKRSLTWTGASGNSNGQSVDLTDAEAVARAATYQEFEDNPAKKQVNKQAYMDMMEKYGLGDLAASGKLNLLDNAPQMLEGIGGAMGAGGGALAGIGSKLASVAGPVGVAIAVGLTAAKVGEVAFKTYDDMRVSGNVQGYTGGEAAKAGFGMEVEARTMALSPFVNMDQAKRIVNASYEGGYKGKQAETVMDFVSQNFKTFNMDTAESMEFYRQSMASGTESTGEMNKQLVALSEYAQESSLSLQEVVKSFMDFKSGIMATAGLGGEAATEFAGAQLGMENYLVEENVEPEVAKQTAASLMSPNGGMVKLVSSYTGTPSAALLLEKDAGITIPARAREPLLSIMPWLKGVTTVDQIRKMAAADETKAMQLQQYASDPMFGLGSNGNVEVYMSLLAGIMSGDLESKQRESTQSTALDAASAVTLVDGAGNLTEEGAAAANDLNIGTVGLFGGTNDTKDLVAGMPADKWGTSFVNRDNSDWFKTDTMTATEVQALLVEEAAKKNAAERAGNAEGTAEGKQNVNVSLELKGVAGKILTAIVDKEHDWNFKNTGTATSGGK